MTELVQETKRFLRKIVTPHNQAVCQVGILVLRLGGRQK